MDKLVVMRIGRSDYSWVNQKKWSTPENLSIIDNQIVRDYFVEDYNVYLVFLETGDIPVYTALVNNVRARNHLDAQYPIGNNHGLFQTFIEFDNIFPITNDISSLYNPLIESIRYIRGHQVPIDGILSESAIAMYKGLDTINQLYLNNMPYIHTNRTVINPEYNLYQG
jgi:hypothetical protein